MSEEVLKQRFLEWRDQYLRSKDRDKKETYMTDQWIDKRVQRSLRYSRENKQIQNRHCPKCKSKDTNPLL